MSRSTLMTLALLLLGCSGGNPAENTVADEARLHRIGGDPANCRLDVVFLHGVDGHYKDTWRPEGDADAYWPGWLLEEKGLTGAAVWSLQYPAATTPLRGESMGLIDRGQNVLALLEAEGFADNPKRPLVFVCHSFGGLVAKQLLRRGFETELKEHLAIARRIKGVVFLGTPHSGSELASFLRFVAGRVMSVTVDDLTRSAPYLRDLNEWYREKAPKNGVDTLAFFETQKTLGIMVVDAISGDPQIAGVRPIGIDKNHLTLCKPIDRGDPMYKLVVRFLTKRLGKPIPPDFPDPHTELTGAKRQADIPSQQVVAQPSKVPASDVVLTYSNRSGDAIALALYDWSRHYANQNGRWHLMENIPPDGKVGKYHRWIGPNEPAGPGTTGWFSCYLMKPNRKFTPCLGTFNLFRSPNPALVVLKNGNDYEVKASLD